MGNYVKYKWIKHSNYKTLLGRRNLKKKKKKLCAVRKRHNLDSKPQMGWK